GRRRRAPGAGDRGAARPAPSRRLDLPVRGGPGGRPRTPARADARRPPGRRPAGRGRRGRGDPGRCGRGRRRRARSGAGAPAGSRECQRTGRPRNSPV
ncbi:MAG: Uncharacterized protein RSP_6119, partial [uncultured Blastococcus sp.]